MKYNEGDKVRIKSKEWYDNNKDEYGNVHLMGEYGWMFTERDSRFCGKVVTIFLKGATSYAIVEDSCEGFWIDEMIECKVEEDFREVVDEYYFDMLGGKSVKEITTIDKAAKVFAEMLVLIGNGTEHGLGGAKEWGK